MANRICVLCPVVWTLLMGATVAGCGGGGSNEAEVSPEAVGIDVGAVRRGPVAFTTVPAAAEPPVQCQDERLTKAFRLGWGLGKGCVAAVWRGFGKCSHVDGFVERVIARIQGLVPEKEIDKARKRCRYVGILEGVFDELDLIQQECVTECFLDGDVVGTIKAKTYCDLVIDALGDVDPVPWIRAPVGTCGVAFEVGCDAKFLATTRAYSNEFGACLPYTTSPFFEIWDASRLQSCDYSQDRE